jgi:hypothetical protein
MLKCVKLAKNRGNRLKLKVGYLLDWSEIGLG